MSKIKNKHKVPEGSNFYTNSTGTFYLLNGKLFTLEGKKVSSKTIASISDPLLASDIDGKLKRPTLIKK